MEWTFDQWISVLTVAGSWLAAIGTVTAIVVALVLARQSGKIKLKARAGISLSIDGYGVEPIRCLEISATNVGERSVRIDTTGWCIGRGKKKRWCVNKVPKSSPFQDGGSIGYGETAMYIWSFVESPSWMNKFAEDFVQDGSDRWLRTLRAQIHTSVGYTETIKPDQSFLNEIKEILEGDRTD